MKLHEKDIQKIEPLPKTAEVMRNTETKEEDFYFNPEKEITLEDWQAIKEFLKNAKEESIEPGHGPHFEEYMNVAGYVSIIKPSFREEIINDQAEIAKIYSPFLKEISKSEDMYFFTHLLTMLFMCFPDLRGKFYFNNNWGEVMEQVNKLRCRSKYKDYAAMMVHAIILRPECKNELPLNQVWPDLRNHLQQMRSPGSRMDLGEVANYAANLILLFPEHRREINFNRQEWNDFKDYLKVLRHRLTTDWDMWWQSIAHLLYSLSILSADQTEITPEGQIKITPKPKPLRKDEPLPQRPV